MNTYVRDLWAKALPQYTQAHSLLRQGDAFCVGGVLADLHAVATGTPWVKADGAWSYLGETENVPKEVLMWAQLHEDDFYPFMDANDLGVTFPELSQRIMAL